MKLNLIVPTLNCKADYFNRLVESLNNQKEEVKNLMKVYIVNQSGLDVDETALNFSYHIINTNKTNASTAKNKALKLFEDEECLIGFPDDDCWYNDKILPFILNQLKERPKFDFFAVSVFDPYMNKPYGHRPLNIEEEIDIENSAILTIQVGTFFKKAKNEILKFDEKLSVGGEWGSGEETDMVLDLLYKNKKGLYVSTESVYHELEIKKEGNLERTYKYGVGFGAMVAKSVVLRKQLLMKNVLKKILRRAAIAKVVYLFNKPRRMTYAMRTKGLKDGYKQGKQFYQGK